MGSCIFCYTVRVRFGFGVDPNPGSMHRYLLQIDLFAPLQVEDAEIATVRNYSKTENNSDDETDSKNAYNASAAEESADDFMDREKAASVAGAIDDAD